MTILKELDFKPSPYIAVATIENNITLLIKEDGSADGSDGNVYYNVSKEVEDTLETVGWSKDTNKTVILDA